MKTMRENMELGVPPRDKIAVHPDEAVALIERQNGHRSLLGLRLGSLLGSMQPINCANLDAYELVWRGAK